MEIEGDSEAEEEAGGVEGEEEEEEEEECEGGGTQVEDPLADTEEEVMETPLSNASEGEGSETGMLFEEV